ncbi:putative ribonuclease H-like domain-containing protein [Tanacetum coccineum]
MLIYIPEFEGYRPKISKSVSENVSNEVRKSPDAPLVEELVSDVDKFEKKTVFPTKIEFVKQQEKPDKEPVKYAEMYKSQGPRGNQRNWNNQKSQQLGSDFVMYNKLVLFVEVLTIYKPTAITIKGKGWQKAVNTARPNTSVVNVVRANQIQVSDGLSPQRKLISLFASRNLIEDMLPLGEEPKEGKLLVNELLKLNSVLFTDTRCFVLSPDFKLADESQVLLKVPRKNNMYSVDMKNIVPKESLTCLVAKATLDESMLWHRRLGHVNFKTINKLVKENLVRGLPLKHFENDQTCVACLKGKQHKASCMSKIQNSITQPLFMLHMDLFGPTFMSILMNKKYCLVVTDDYCDNSRISV